MHSIKSGLLIARIFGSSYGDVTFVPADDDYFGFATSRPPAKQTKASYRVRVPGVRKLTSDLVRGNRVLLCSERFKETIEELGAPRVEFFPVDAFLSNNKPVESKYYGIHISDRWPCLDLHASEFFDKNSYTRSGNLDDVHSIQRMVLDINKIPSDSKLFYIENSPFPYLPVVAMDSESKVLLSKNWSGFEWVSIHDFSWDEIS